MDFFADNMVKRIIGEIIINGDNIKTNEYIWYQLTKCLIKQQGLAFALSNINQIVCELSNEQWFEDKYPPEIFKEKKETRVYDSRKSKLNLLINSRLSIIEVAKNYGLDTDKKGKTTCPFHFDTDPSLILDKNKNTFHCFGCHAKGDIITFIRKMEEMKSGDKKGG